MSGHFGGTGRTVAAGLAAVSLLGAAYSVIHFSTSSYSSSDADTTTEITRSPASQSPSVKLTFVVDRLFSESGRNHRADVFQRQIMAARKKMEPESVAKAPTPSSAEDVPFIAASLTPVDMGRLGPTRAAEEFRYAVNRNEKADRLPAPQISFPESANDMLDEPMGTLAAFRMIAPSKSLPEIFAESEGTTTTAAISEQDELERSSQAQPGNETRRRGSTWSDLIKLARVDGGDGRKIEPRIFGALTEDEFRAREFRCMATAVYFEARGESIEGQIAVGQVIMTRVRSDYYPNTICGVVFQGQWNRNACQFSFACDGRTDSPRNRKQWDTAIDVAKKVISGEVYLKKIGGATHYHATYVSPKWRKMMDRVAKIGVHIFYKADFVRPLVASTELDDL